MHSMMPACKPTPVTGEGFSKPCIGVHMEVSLPGPNLNPDADSGDDDTP